MQPGLFDPCSVRQVTLRNRVVVSPMLSYCAEGGHPNDFHLIHYGKLACGGAGLVFVESTKVDPRGCSTPHDLGLWKDDYIEPWRRITRFIKSQGAIPGIQLSHSGRKARRAVPWQGGGPLREWTSVEPGQAWQIIGPSAIAHGAGYSVPHALTQSEIEQCLRDWEHAARRALCAGFEAIEIHGAHGYLIHQFLSPRANLRSDAYGASLAGRMRFAIEVAASVRRSWPADKPLFFRISAVDNAGWTLDDSTVLARELGRAGVDVIDCSSGGMGEESVTNTARPYGYQVGYARHIREQAGVMTMAVGLIAHADQADGIIRAGDADLVALGRELLHNPNWPLDAAHKLGLRKYDHIPKASAYYLEKRAANPAFTPSTWRRGLRQP
ncbi:MAG: hypothetical protein ABT05_06625 [Lautropia sp. SCN 66-9]|nr:MAG: hypothetical protein ABT05_06625 [Lautropia sp. SCN 66-9]